MKGYQYRRCKKCKRTTVHKESGFKLNNFRLVCQECGFKIYIL